MSHMGFFNTAQSRRHIPLLLHLVGEVEHTVQRLPRRPAVLTAKQPNRADAHVDDPLVMAVHSESADISFHDLLPGLAGVQGPITAVESHSRKYDLRSVVAADQVLDGFALEELTVGVHRSALRLHDLETPVVRDVIA